MPSPAEEYHSRLVRWTTLRDANARASHQLGNARLAVGLGAAALAGLSIAGELFSPWWLLLPVVIFAAMVFRHGQLEQSLARANRAVSYYGRLMARVNHQWAGTGPSGERFKKPDHLFALDLDVFGDASLFERISLARTASGENTLALWLTETSSTEEVRERQAAVKELAPGLDLREEIALLGDDVRAAVDDRFSEGWGKRPAVRFPPGARWIATALAAAAGSVLILYFLERVSARWLLGTILTELIFGLFVRNPVLQVVGAVAAPAHELRLLGLLLARLEKNPFNAPYLQRLLRPLDEQGLTASAEIGRLVVLVERLDSARNQFFRALAAPLLWVTQCAIAIESWRQTNGPKVGEWLAAVGEFEALCSLASFAYEQPSAVFPQLLEENMPAFRAMQMQHPLIDPGKAIANDIDLSRDSALWIVSGSNMSGKSTYLRAIGLNAVLAWAGAPVCCESLTLSPLRIGASIRINDSLADNRSRFYAEISRLREIVDLAKSGAPTLFLLDELLSGTNSHDRRIGASAVVRSLVELGAIGLVTTHDLALAEIVPSLQGRARNVHFADQMEKGEMQFDYRLREGVVEHSNALALMRAVGLDV